MAYTEADLEAIDKAIASGELEVSIGDRRVRYRGMKELKDARKLIIQELAATDGNRRQLQFRLRVSKGA